MSPSANVWLFTFATSLVASELVVGSPTSWLRSSLIKFESSEHSEIRVSVDSLSSRGEVGVGGFMASTGVVASSPNSVFDCSSPEWIFETGIDWFGSPDLSVDAALTLLSFLFIFAGTIADSHPIYK